MHILGEMAKAMTAPREEVGKNAPRIVQIQIPTDKIRDVIGTGGKVIREIVEKTGAKVNVEDDGTVKVASANAESIEAAVKWIKSLTSEPEVGQIYEGKVVKVMEFGAFVNYFGAKDGLVHVSQLSKERVEKPGDVVKEGDIVKVKLLGFDDRGKTRLSMKVVDQATGEDLSAQMGADAEDHGPRRERGEGGDRGDRGHRRGGRDRGDRPRRESSGD
jgi:polyribonucleotide nucleotidyltransferase